MPSVTDIPSLDPEVGQPLIYTVLGLSALSFCLTFFLAPKFKGSLKEEDDWKTIYNSLMETGGVQTITAEQARAKRGAVVLDVRLERKAASGVADGSINIPLYQPIQGWDLASSVRRAAFAFFGIFGTERNPDFIDEVLSTIPKNKEVVILCEMGGSMENKSGTKTGFQSRSLKALHCLRQAGYSKLYHLEEGIGGWQRAGFKMVELEEA